MSSPRSGHKIGAFAMASATLGIFFVLFVLSIISVPFSAHADSVSATNSAGSISSATSTESTRWFCINYNGAPQPFILFKKVREVAERWTEKYACADGVKSTDLASSTPAQKAIEKGNEVKTQVKVITTNSLKTRLTAFVGGLIPKAVELVKSLIKP
jgi:hypothetical protein